MPAVQTTYANSRGAGYPGMIANGEWVTNIISRIVDPAASTAISFGDPVLQGASEQLVVSANGGSGAFRGIAIRDVTLPPADGDQYPATATVGRDDQGRRLGQCGVPRSAPASRSISRRPACSPTSSTGNTAFPTRSGKAPPPGPPWPSCG